MVCTFIDTLCKYTTCIIRTSWCYWSAVDCEDRATCSWSRLTALLLGRLLGVLLFTEARSMGRSVQWSPMKPESELIRLVPTKVFADLLLSLVTLRLTERATRTAGTVRFNRPEASCWLNWTLSRNYFTSDSQSANMSWYRVPLWDLRPDIISCRNVLRRLLNCLEVDPSVKHCSYHGKSCLSGCYLDTDLRKRYLVTEVLNMWEDSMWGSRRVYGVTATAVFFVMTPCSLNTGTDVLMEHISCIFR
jgi:hypothetical protein